MACINREVREKPCVSSTTASRVRVASEKPKADRRSLTASGPSTPGLGTPGLGTPGLGTPGLGTPGLALKTSRRGRKKRRSWIVRAVAWCWASSASKRARALALGSSR